MKAFTMKLYKRSILALAICALTACGGSGSSATNTPPGTPPVVASPTPTTLYGPLITAEIALIGKDDNGNGIRDDVESWITTNFKDAPTQNAAKTRAQWLTWVMLRGSRNLPVTESDANAVAAASACWYETAYLTLGPAMPSANEWEALLFNTHARAVAYLTWDANSDGIVRKIGVTPCKDVIAVSPL
ncbi:MAG: hypothetical protein Q7U16_12205 [Agitococcus sp.]|nr:hypothetical protein [Agitococcus sp.]